MLPDTAKLADNLRCCLQENDDTPRDFNSLFSNNLYTLDTSTVPKVIRYVWLIFKLKKSYIRSKFLSKKVSNISFICQRVKGPIYLLSKI